MTVIQPKGCFKDFDVFIFSYILETIPVLWTLAATKKNQRGAAISACEKGHRWIAAVEVFETMLKVSLQPHVVSYNAVPRTGPGRSALWLKQTRLVVDVKHRD